MNTKCFFILVLLCLGGSTFAQEQKPATWSEGEVLPVTGRPNPFALSPAEFQQARNQGQIHAQIYPVDVTGVLPPYEPLRRALDEGATGGLEKYFEQFFKNVSGIHSTKDLFKWLGLHDYPAATDEGVYQVALPAGARPDHPMGLGFLERNGATGFTFSCATCHSANLFGKTVLGMTNRFPRANEMFFKSKQAINLVPAELFQFSLHSTAAEKALYAEVRNNLQAVGIRQPEVLGLDTSLPQVSLSLSRRNADQYATRSAFFEKFPRPNWLENNPADSKPAVWWNMKYKNRWGCDGALVSGNPIYTNLLWNELGRGADLEMLEKWLDNNQQIIRDLTTAVFSTEAPKWSDFFTEESINLQNAQAGEQLFNQNCAHCHGTYAKGWSRADASTLTWRQLIATTEVKYFPRTKVMDVGTDPQRWMGMKYILPLNDLSISKKTNMLLRNDRGYVPQPLVGIWARWPYFHNNSAPNLCAVLTKASDRPVSFYMGEANDKNTDFDKDCVGYPTGDRTPASWKTAEYFFNTRKKALGNSGHDEGIFLEDGKEIYSPLQKQQIIDYLKTL